MLGRWRSSNGVAMHAPGALARAPRADARGDRDAIPLAKIYLHRCGGRFPTVAGALLVRSSAARNLGVAAGLAENAPTHSVFRWTRYYIRCRSVADHYAHLNELLCAAAILLHMLGSSSTGCFRSGRLGRAGIAGGSALGLLGPKLARSVVTRRHCNCIFKWKISDRPMARVHIQEQKSLPHWV